MNHERRQTPRHAVRLLVQYQASAGEPFEVDYVTDLSASGMFIATPKPMPRDATLHVQFAPARDSRLVSTFCRVTRVTSQGIGAEFVGLDSESAKLIESSLAH